MSDDDLPEITELFRREYSLRYRMVQIMFYECPEACFVYEKEDRILGLTFNKVDCNELYMRQLFVREEYRHYGIGTALYQRRLKFARDLNLLTMRGNIRGEVKGFYRGVAQMLKENTEYYIIRGN